jgi:hypothetical protein
MQLPIKYKESFEVPNESPLLTSCMTKGLRLETLKFSLYSSGSCIPINYMKQTVPDYKQYSYLDSEYVVHCL